jgi:hypothetical protein
MAGTHGFDMINRIKQNRDLLKAKKERKTLKGLHLLMKSILIFKAKNIKMK